MSAPIKIPKRKKKLMELKKDNFPGPPPSLRRSESSIFSSYSLHDLDLLSEDQPIHVCNLCQNTFSCPKCVGWGCPAYVTNKKFTDIRGVNSELVICSTKCFQHFILAHHQKQMDKLINLY